MNSRIKAMKFILKSVLVGFILIPVLNASHFIDQIHVQKLSEKTVLVKTGTVYPDQVAAINTQKGIVLIDAGISPTLSQEYKKLIRQEFGNRKIRYVINTHHHFDHTNGNQVFTDATIIAHANAPGQMKAFGNNITSFLEYREKRYQRRDSLMRHLDPQTKLHDRLKDLVLTSSLMCDDLKSKFKLTLPSLTFQKKLTLHMGDMTIHLVYFGSGYHTDNDILIYIPEEGLVFTGDILQDYKTLSNVTSETQFDTAIHSLNYILQQQTPVKHIITIHAGILPAEKLSWFRDTLRTMKSEKNKKISAISELEKSIQQYGAAKGIVEFNKYCQTHSDIYYLWEGDLIELATKHSFQKEFDQAIAILKFGVSLFPESPDINDCLGESYMNAGMNEMAIATFYRSLELYPLNSWAREMIYILNSKNK